MISNLIRRLQRRIRRHSKASVRHHYEGFHIALPSSHLLPEYQRGHPKYDKFLPHLASYVDSGGTIVDIGANVGDTLAAMVERNPDASYVCIEPDDQFHRYLEHNAERIRQAVSGVTIRLIKALVGQNISNVSLDGTGGTKHAVADGAGSIQSQPLDALLADQQGLTIRIIKSDVDGFDYDVLDSSRAVINCHGPMLFFECYYTHEYQMRGFSTAFRTLEAEGYRDWIVFDNFGEFMLRTADLAVLDQLLDYVWKQNAGTASRTIHYYDILAVQDKDSALIDRVLGDYQ
jgi:FkbM family methyltransferase